MIAPAWFFALWLPLASAPASDSTADPLAPWRTGVVVKPVEPSDGRHSIHSYFNASPESPDGRYVLYFSSTDPKAQEGEICVRERATGQQRVIASGVATEDAHRVACQQWASQGRCVVFHDVRDGRWRVVCVDLASGRPRTLVEDRQLGWGRPQSDWVPVYGCHWNPGEHRDLELVHLATGEIRTAVTAAAVAEAYPEAIARNFGTRPVSIYFPIVSPDEQRVFFKMATPAGGDFRSAKASVRLLFVCYDLKQQLFLMIQGKWGHPAWHPDSRTVLDVGPALVDTSDGKTRRIPGLPRFPGSHPSVSPDGRLFVTDTLTEPLGGPKGEWGIVVGRLDGNDCAIVHRFDNSRGARSWRVSHPHPSFSPDGQRIYFNVSSTAWTRLHVAEAGDGGPPTSD